MKRRRADEHLDGTIQVSGVGRMLVLIDSDGITQKKIGKGDGWYLDE